MIRISLISLLLLCCQLVLGQKGQLNFDQGMDYYNRKQCTQAYNAFKEAMNQFLFIEKAAGPVVGMAYYWMGRTIDDLPNCNLNYSAMDYFTRAADKGYAPAYTALGVAYATGIQEGKTGPRDENRALTYFQKAAQMGDAGGLYHLANCYLNGTAIKKDEAKALDLLIQAIIGGNREAIAALKQFDRQKVNDKLQKTAKKKMTDTEQLQLARSFHTLEDYRQAFTWFQKSAEQGNMIAQALMGHYYESGSYGIPVDGQKALDYYLQSAGNGYVPAQIRLGEMYSEGRGVPKDPQEAFEWYLKAANNGYSVAQDWIADHYYSKGDNRAAAEWYLKAAENGSSVSQNRLGVMYLEGKGVPKDLKKALEWYLKSAEQGWHWGQYNAGLCYEYGFGTTKNEEKAYVWYQKAAENNNNEAQYKMGMRCNNQSKFQQAVDWFGKSAEQDNYQAQYELGNLYFSGIGVEVNLPKAFELFAKSADKNHSPAQCMLGACYGIGAGVEKNPAKAMEWYLKSAEQDNASAQNQLGLAYLNGEITGRDATQAVKWFTKSAVQNNQFAQYNLAGCYERGEGVAKDLTTAEEWYRKALANGNQVAKVALDRLSPPAQQASSTNSQQPPTTYGSAAGIAITNWPPKQFPCNIPFKVLGDIKGWKIESIVCLGRDRTGYQFKLTGTGLAYNRSYSTLNFDIEEKGSPVMLPMGAYMFSREEPGKKFEMTFSGLWDGTYTPSKFAGFLITP